MIKLERVNGKPRVQEFIAEAEAMLPIDIDSLLKGNDSQKAAWKEGPRNPHFRNLCHYLALGGFYSSSVRQKIEEGRCFYVADSKYKWLPKEVRCITEADKIGEGDIVIVNNFTNNVKTLIEKTKGVKFYTYKDIYLEILTESNLSVEDLKTYMLNAKFKQVEDKFQYKVNRLTLNVWRDKDVWCLCEEGGRVMRLRNFHSVNGVPIMNKNVVMLLVLNYLLCARDAQTLKGRKAYLSNIFQEEVNIGYSHKILNAGIANKLGAINFYVEGNHQVIVYDSKDIITPIKAFEEMGYSILFHKGAKYAIIDAGMIGYTRKDNTSHVPYHADKRAKLTGRVLSMVPTAGLWVED